jgi:hypothetical protein
MLLVSVKACRRRITLRDESSLSGRTSSPSPGSWWGSGSFFLGDPRTAVVRAGPPPDRVGPLRTGGPAAIPHVLPLLPHLVLRGAVLYALPPRRTHGKPPVGSRPDFGQALSAPKGRAPRDEPGPQSRRGICVRSGDVRAVRKRPEHDLSLRFSLISEWSFPPPHVLVGRRPPLLRGRPWTNASRTCPFSTINSEP